MVMRNFIMNKKKKLSGIKKKATKITNCINTILFAVLLKLINLLITIEILSPLSAKMFKMYINKVLYLIIAN